MGKKLFHDTRLSADGQISCASCHVPQLAFSDGRAVSVGHAGQHGTRNAPSLLGLQASTSFFWDGREDSLTSAIMQPFTHPAEMGLADIAALAERLRPVADYAPLFQSRGSSLQLDTDRLAQAIAAYLLALPAASGPAYRHWDVQDPALEPVLSADAQAGLALFNGKAECGSCHIFTRENRSLTDEKTHHSGIGFEQVAGHLTATLQALDQAGAQQPIGHLILSDRGISELGRFSSSRQADDIGAFRTPSLRNVARTAPYMHDGSVATLEAAVDREIYYRNLSREHPIHLTRKEQRELLAFLHALSDGPASSVPSPR